MFQAILVANLFDSLMHFLFLIDFQRHKVPNSRLNIHFIREVPDNVLLYESEFMSLSHV